MFPVMLSLRNRRCLVVGGGGVALRKTLSLVAEGALVTVVAPEVAQLLEELAEAGQIALEKRAYRVGEGAQYVLVFAATDQRQVNRRVFDDANAAGVWVNVADDPELSSFHLPARLQRGSLQLAIGSGGDAPFVVRRLRRLLEGRFGDEWGAWSEAAGRFRREVRRRGFSSPEQEARFDRFFAQTVDPERLRARVPTAAEERTWLEDNGGAEASVGLSRCEERPSGSVREEGCRCGFVSLVGAGPGCAGLLTVRGRQRLLAADAVVYDRLAASVLPCELAPRVELHAVGKEAGHHPVPQEEINAQLVRLAREGKRVVRLKGGDPYVFGRGGEEAEELSAQGIPFEVVPGVTAGIAAPGWVGIPVTHRREAVRLTLLTAHESIKEEGSQVRWDLLAQDTHATVVGYMGMSALPRVVEKVLAAGMDPETPAAMVQNGTSARQRSVVSTLAALPSAVEREGLSAPALFVIGPTVRRAARLDWFGRLPLAGERIVVSAAHEELAQALEASGAEVVVVPLPVTPAARVVMGASPLTGCVLCSPAEVEGLDEERGGAGWGGKVIAWCRGRETAARARKRGWRWVERMEGINIEQLSSGRLSRDGALG